MYSSARTIVREVSYPYSKSKRPSSKLGSCGYCTREDEDTMMLCDGGHGTDVIMHWACAGVPPQQPNQPVPQTFPLPDGTMITVSLAKTYCRGCRAIMGELWPQLRKPEGTSNRLWPHLLEAENARIEQNAKFKPGRAPKTPKRKGSGSSSSTRRKPKAGKKLPATYPTEDDSETAATDQSCLQNGKDGAEDDSEYRPFENETVEEAVAPVCQVPAPVTPSRSRNAATNASRRSSVTSPPSIKSGRVCRSWAQDEEDIVAYYVAISLNGPRVICDTERWMFVEDALAQHGYSRTWTALRQCWSYRLRQHYGVDERTEAAKQSNPMNLHKAKGRVRPTFGKTMDQIRAEWRLERDERAHITGFLDDAFNEPAPSLALEPLEPLF